jgi:recombinational DNA repair protein (RecF pathway)
MQQELLEPGLELPEFDFDATPQTDSCSRCGSSDDPRFVILRGRSRYVGATLCETCAEEALEVLIGA